MIKLERIVKDYHMGDISVRALAGVDLEVAKGEYVAIMGPSGSGKSTLMHIIGCLDRPTSGRYLLDGNDVADMTDEDLARIRNKHVGFVFQQFNLLPRETLQANVESRSLRRYQGPRAAPPGRRGPAPYGLGRQGHHRPSEVSGGQKQRAAIARALVNSLP